MTITHALFKKEDRPANIDNLSATLEARDPNFLSLEG
jgi:hypothetical protein